MGSHHLDAIRELCAADSAAAVFEALVDAAAALDDADVAEVAVPDDGRLVVTASSAPDTGEIRSYQLALSIPGASFTQGRACLVDDCADTRSAASLDADGAGPGHRSLACAPLGDRGVLVVKARNPGALDDSDEAVAEALADWATAALRRIDAASVVRPIANGGRADPEDDDRLEAVASILAHDLTSLLETVEGSIELGVETGDDDHHRRARRVLERADELVDSLVVLARTGEYVAETEPIDLAGAVERTASVLPENEATVEVVASAEIVASPTALVHLLENLLRNAIDHAGVDVTVRIGTLGDGFYVEDDGPGIPPDRREAVFDLGYSSVGGHTGIGLNIVERLVRAHGWSIDVTEADSGGARFEVTGVEFAD